MAQWRRITLPSHKLSILSHWYYRLQEIKKYGSGLDSDGTTYVTNFMKIRAPSIELSYGTSRSSFDQRQMTARSLRLEDATDGQTGRENIPIWCPSLTVEHKEHQTIPDMSTVWSTGSYTGVPYATHCLTLPPYTHMRIGVNKENLSSCSYTCIYYLNL